jgi:hypothetical protein
VIACLTGYALFEDSGTFIARQSAEVLQSSLYSIQAFKLLVGHVLSLLHNSGSLWRYTYRRVAWFIGAFMTTGMINFSFVTVECFSFCTTPLHLAGRG